MRLGVLAEERWWCGGGFFLACEDLKEHSTILSPPAQFFFLFIEEISLGTLNSLFMPGSVHSGPASLDDCGLTFLDKLRVSSFANRFPHYAILHETFYKHSFSTNYMGAGIAC